MRTQPHDRDLAGASWADDRGHRAFRHDERHGVEYPVAIVGEPNLIQFDAVR